MNNNRYIGWGLLFATLLFCNAAMYGQNDIKLSVSKWSFRTQTVLLCDMAKQEGVESVEMADALKWDIILQSGLTVAMADGADLGIERGFCNPEWHGQLLQRYTKVIQQMEQRGIKQVVCYAGLNTNLSDEEALEVCVEGLKPVLELAEKACVILCMELLSSREAGDIFARQRFKYYQCDNVEWGVALCKKLDSPSFRLLYDTWHMRDMGRDVIADVRKYHPYISHYQVASWPGRKSLHWEDGFDYRRFMKEVRKTGYKGFIGIEPDRMEHDLQGNMRKSVTILKGK